MLFDEHRDDHTTEVTAKANRVLYMIKRSFEHFGSSVVQSYLQH